MTVIKVEKHIEGDVVPASEMNQPYVDLAASKLDASNTSDSWAIYEHFDSSGDTFNNPYSYRNSTDVPWLMDTDVYETVHDTTVPAVLTVNKQALAPAILRVTSDGLVGEINEIDDGDGTPAEATHNVYTFRLQVKTDLRTFTIAEVSYSLTGKAMTTNGKTALFLDVQWRNFCLSGIAIIAPLETVETITLEAKVDLTGNEVNITHHNIIAFFIEN